MEPTIAISTFVSERNKASQAYTCSDEVLLAHVKENWSNRTPGAGRTDLNKVVLVHINNDLSIFKAQWIAIKNAHSFETKMVYRQSFEDPYLDTTALGPTLPVKKAFAVCYSRAALLENDGSVSSDCDWEVVAVIASPWENEPMMPLTMARNYLQMPGGTYAPYTEKQLAESIYFWSGFVRSRI